MLTLLTGYHSYVGDHKTNVRFIIPTHMSTKSDNLVKISQIHCEIRWNMPDFPFFHIGIQMSHVIYGITGPKLNNFLQDVGLFIVLLMQSSAFQYSNWFQNGRT